MRVGVACDRQEGKGGGQEGAETDADREKEREVAVGESRGRLWWPRSDDAEEAIHGEDYRAAEGLEGYAPDTRALS